MFNALSYDVFFQGRLLSLSQAVHPAQDTKETLRGSLETAYREIVEIDFPESHLEAAVSFLQV